VTVRLAIPSTVLLILSVISGPAQNAVAPTDAAPPTIAQGGVVNLASRMPARLTSGAIARGSLVSIQGWRLGPVEQARAAGSTLAPSLAGVSVRITQGAFETDALPIMVSATEIHALLPESVAPGDIEVRVVRNGMLSRTPARLRVVESSFGAFSQNGRGWGPGDIRNADGQINSMDHAAKPGEIVTLRGTGLGRATEPQSTQVLVGNREASITSVADGKGQALGVDQIGFALPEETPEGCYVPVRVRSGGRVSNTVTAAINRSGGACPGVESWIKAQTDQPGKLAFLALVRVSLRLVLTRREKADYAMDVGYGSFELRKSGDQPSPYYMFPVPGTCTTLAGSMTLTSLFSPLSKPVQAIGVHLDAGSSVTVQGVNGQRKFQSARTSVLGGDTPWPQAQSKRFPLFLSPGDYTISTAGGRDVGPFTSTVHVTAPIDWTNRDGIGTVDRERGVTVKWRAAHADGLVLITAINSDEESGGVGMCSCVEHASAGSFHVPPDALANIPPTPADQRGLPTNMLLVAELPGDDTVRTLSSVGIEHVVAFFASVSARTVSFR
jgi:uncharacterized protein (TIGR03437 family)